MPSTKATPQKSPALVDMAVVKTPAPRREKNRWPSGIPNLMVLALAKVATQQASFGSPMQCSLAPATTFASVYARIVSVMAVLGTLCFVQVQEFRGNRETSRVHTDHIAQGNAQRAREQSAEVAINSCSTGELSRHEHLSHVYVVVQHVHMHVACCCMLLLHHIQLYVRVLDLEGLTPDRIRHILCTSIQVCIVP